MCGLAGMLAVGGAPIAPDTVNAMLRRIAHRGPDDRGLFLSADGLVALGHRRLSIIDLSAASHQPMVDEATGIVLAFNGEIYNFRDLRATLASAGHRFRSVGDTEVLLRAYIEWGIDCVERLCGMFAFAIWDPRSRVIHLARDPMGMKPLYLCHGQGWIAFASEIKAFLGLPGFCARLDLSAVQQFLEFGYIFEDHRTSLVGVSKLEPGERVELAERKVRHRETWFVPPRSEETDVRGERERVAELRSTLDRVVAEHLIADVPVGLLLSGGLDSSVIAALAARQAPITTISMGFDQSEIDERPDARRVAEHIGSRHVDVLITAQDVRREIETGAWVFDDLFADWGTISTRLLYRRCRELGLKVVLVGEGADELFGGYDIFRQPRSLGLWRRFRLYQRYAGRRHGRLFRLFDHIISDYLSRSGGDPFEAVRLFESRRQLPNQYVMKVDKASMAESVEARAPYLDRRVAELAYRTPSAWLLRNDTNKYLLRAVGASDGLLPTATANREKFGAPLAASWMDEDPAFRAFARDRILASNSRTRDIGLADAMNAYYKRGLSGFKWPRALSLFRNLSWRLLLLELWSDHYLGSAETAGVPTKGAEG
jgi:asparagine synthase (glutamine-hydrolysing)